MQITKYHSKYYATLLTLQNSSDSVNRLSQLMFNVQIEAHFLHLSHHFLMKLVLVKR